jgi:hypothetical protein
MADIEDRSALAVSGVAHSSQAFLLKFHITDSKDLVHDHDLTVEMCGDRKRKLDIHAG